LGWLGLPVPAEARFAKQGSRRNYVHPWLIRTVRMMTPITQVIRRVFPRGTECIRDFVLRKGTRTLSRLDPDQHARLQAEFFPDFSELESLIGRSLTHWRMDGAVERPSGSARFSRSSAGPAAPADVVLTQAMPSRVPVRTPRP
jgi:hypothetical protein